MLGTLSLAALLGSLTISSQTALAVIPDALDGPLVAMADQDDDDDDGDEETDEVPDYGGDDIDLDVFQDALEPGDEENVHRISSDDALDSGDTEEQRLDDLDSGGDQEEVYDFDDEYDQEVQIGGPGQDTARIYRTYKENIEDLGPDEEVIQWERYLEQYPNSLFRDHIQRRMDELTEFQYSERVPLDEGFEDIVDAGMREIDFFAPRHLEPLDPRSKMRAAFEWGFPEYLNLLVDYEDQIMRQWSWHVGVRRRYAGWNLEAGSKYALIKSARTNFLLTGIFDVHANTNPFFPAVRPQLGVGKRFIVAGHPLDLMAQGGVDLEFRLDAPMGVIHIGGFNATYEASDKVAFFVESSVVAKNLLWEDGDVFRFPLATFGITFWANEKNTTSASIAANAPYAYGYWGYHFGGVMGDFNFYLDD